MKKSQKRTWIHLLKWKILFSAIAAYQVPRHLLTYDIPDVLTYRDKFPKMFDSGFETQNEKTKNIETNIISKNNQKRYLADQFVHGKSTQEIKTEKFTNATHAEVACDINGVHLSPGEEFEKLINWPIVEDGRVLYVVGFSSFGKCDLNLLEINLMVKNTVSLKIPAVKEREYIAPKDSGVEYHRYFYFFKIKMEYVRASPCGFNYTVRHENKKSEQFNFTSQVFCGYSYKIVTFGQNDDTIAGIATIDNLKHYHHDLLILTGNYVSGYHFDNGRLQESYFNAIEHLMASTVVMILPGRRESFDNYRMFKSRFMMPGCKGEVDCDLFYFHDYGIQIFMMNIDRYLLYPESDMRLYLQKFRELVESQEMERENRSGWKFVFTNVHFYCSDPRVYDNCISNLILLKEFEDLFELFHVNLVISSSLMLYESVRNVYNFEVRQTHNVPRNYIISGMAGCHNYLIDDDFLKMSQLSFHTESLNPSVVSIDIFENFYKVDLMEIPDFVSRDLRFMNLKFEFAKLIGFGIFCALMAAVFLLFEFTNASRLGEKYAKRRLNKVN